ncbi:11674_t:CDS:2, partial [Racocetra fulgida]
YNYPSKIGDEEVYTEPKFSFPHWDDEISGYTPPTRYLRRRASFPSAHASLHDDIRALQREIEKFEAVCMSSGWNSTKDRDVRQSETASTVTGSLMAAAVINGPGRTLASQSATAAARGQRQPLVEVNQLGV